MNDILEQADKIISGEREQTYGKAEDSFQIIGGLWSAYTGHEISSKDVALMMCLFKIARERNGHKDDNLVDLCGYGALAGRCSGS